MPQADKDLFVELLVQLHRTEALADLARPTDLKRSLTYSEQKTRNNDLKQKAIAYLN